LDASNTSLSEEHDTEGEFIPMAFLQEIACKKLRHKPNCHIIDLGNHNPVLLYVHPKFGVDFLLGHIFLFDGIGWVFIGYQEARDPMHGIMVYCVWLVKP